MKLCFRAGCTCPRISRAEGPKRTDGMRRHVDSSEFAVTRAQSPGMATNQISGISVVASRSYPSAFVVLCGSICLWVRCEVATVSIDTQFIRCPVVTLHELNPIIVRVGEDKSSAKGRNQS